MFQVDDTAVVAARDDCERPIHKRRTIILSSVVPTVSLALLTLILVYLYRRRRKRLLDQRHADRTQILMEDRFEFRFPVFLSYSSDDNDFVNMHILEPLQV